MSYDGITPQMKREIGEATKLLSRAILGKELASLWDCSESNISQAGNGGYGEIKKIVSSILAAENSKRFGTKYTEADVAIHKTVKVIAKAGGFYIFKPIDTSRDELESILDAAERILHNTSVLIHELKESISEHSDGGREVTDKEKGEIHREAELSIGTLLGLVEFLNR